MELTLNNSAFICELLKKNPKYYLFPDALTATEQNPSFVLYEKVETEKGLLLEKVDNNSCEEISEFEEEPGHYKISGLVMSQKTALTYDQLYDKWVVVSSIDFPLSNQDKSARIFSATLKSHADGYLGAAIAEGVRWFADDLCDEVKDFLS